MNDHTSESDSPVACSFVYTDEDSGALLRAYLRVNPMMQRARRAATWRWFRFLGILWVVAFFALAALVWRGGGASAPGWLFRIVLGATFIMCLAAIAGGLQSLPGFGRIATKALGRRMPPRRGTFSAEVAEGWIRLSSEDSDESIRLATVNEVLVEDGYIYLVIDQTPRMQIPERGFDSQEECQAFIAQLQHAGA